MFFNKSGSSPCLLTVVEHRTSASFFHVYSLLLLLYHFSNTLLMQLYKSEQSTEMVFSVDCSSPNPRPTFSQSTCTLTPLGELVLAQAGLQILSKSLLLLLIYHKIKATLRLNTGFGRISCTANSFTSYKD